MKFSSVTGDDDELWWEASFSVPKDALAVNFVVNCEGTWDNNGGKDHKVRGRARAKRSSATSCCAAQLQLVSGMLCRACCERTRATARRGAWRAPPPRAPSAGSSPCCLRPRLPRAARAPPARACLADCGRAAGAAHARDGGGLGRLLPGCL